MARHHHHKHRSHHHRPGSWGKSNKGVRVNKNRPLPPHKAVSAAPKGKNLPVPPGPLFNKKLLVQEWKTMHRSIGPGLVNVGNTCFLNSVLQCLTYTPTLAEALLSPTIKTHDCPNNFFCAMCAMKGLVKRCLQEPKSFKPHAAILPRAFTGNLRAISSGLNLGTQEDAHEFMLALLSAMHKATVRDFKQSEVTNEKESTSFIYSIFGGEMQSNVTCPHCKDVSVTPQNFLDLGIDISSSQKGYSTHPSVIGALHSYIQPEPVEGYTCPSCKRQGTVSKKMTVNALPPMLILQVKRFGYSYYGLHKKRDFVAFQETLDMAPFVTHPSKLTKSSKYQLYAVLVHMGSDCHSGHYYAFVKAPNGQWYCMDDESVSPVSFSEVQRAQAYMLFYSSDGSPVVPSKAVSPVKTKSQAPAAVTKNNITPPTKNSTTPSPLAAATTTSAPSALVSSVSAPAVVMNGIVPKRKALVEEEDDSDSSDDEDFVPETKRARTSDASDTSESSEESSDSELDDEVAETSSDDDDAISQARSTRARIAAFRLNAWVESPLRQPFRSLRGDLSPPTFAAALSDDSRWNVQELEAWSHVAKEHAKRHKRAMKRWKISAQ
ncbi:hypothetical protein BC940DRAFT_278341 [Gongronella butleri]|nr:hypothetical protein BC940DRAFT_278341 [Gongronella butleri]